MFRDQTVFVIGAGASVDFGLPTGAQLVDQIGKSAALRFERGYEQKGGDASIAAALKSRPTDKQNSLFGKFCRLSDAMGSALSIDTYLDTMCDPDITWCGKVAIANAILRAERGSRLYCDPGLSLTFSGERHTSTWLDPFFKILQSGASVKSVESILSRVSFVVFNYDRCLEQALIHWIGSFFSIGEERAARIVNSCNILHPYGTVGRLPWQDPSGHGVPFGADLQPERLIAVAESLRTFTERHGERELLYSVRETIEFATQLVFLGFSYGRQNMEFLTPNSPSQVSRVIGTSLGISEPNKAVIVEELKSMLPNESLDVHLVGIDSGSILREFERLLSK